MKKLHPLIMLAVVVGLTMLPASALAAPAKTVAPPKALWVSPVVTPSPLSSSVKAPAVDTSCATASYHTIQSAITAAPAGATVNICAGTYVEQLTITQSVSLVAVGAVTVQLPAVPVVGTTVCDAANLTAGFEADQDGIVICGVATVNMTGLTIDPAWSSGTCNDSLYGILVGGGATLDLTDSSVIAGGAVPVNGCQGGVAVQVGMAWTTPVEVGHATLVDDNVSGYQKNGVTVDGSGSSATISRTTVTGAGPTPETAQNGIQISNGAFGTITNSTITGNECNNVNCSPDSMTEAQAGGVLFYGPAAGSSVTDSTISDNDYGVYNAETTAAAPRSPAVAINQDTLVGDRYEGILLDQGWASITGDSINGGNVGIQVLQYSGQTYGANGTALFDTIRNETVAAVQVDSDQASGDLHGTLSIDLSDLRGNAARVLDNSLNYTVIQLLNL